MTDLMAEMLSEEEFLEHSGVKGMKWGQRKGSVNTSHTSADAARYNKIASRSKKNGLDNLSNDDIAKLNKRNQLVADYKKNNPTTFQKGHKSVKNALGVIGTVAAVGVAGRKIVRSPLAKAGAKIVADVLKNMASGNTGPVNGGTYVQVLKSITS